jgi:hypothetical protein
MSKGLALVPALGLDDYVALHQDRSLLFYLWQGRFTQALIQAVLTDLGLPPTAIAWPVIILFFFFAAWAITSGVLYIASNKGSAFGLAAIGAVIASHPYLTEYFTFRESLITQGASFALLSLVFFVWQQNKITARSVTFGRYALLLILMVLLAGAQQTTFIILGFFIIAGMVQQVLDADLGRSKARCDAQRKMLTLYLTAAFFYIVIYALIRKVSDAPMDSRSSIVGLGELGSRVKLIISLTKKLFLDAEPTLSLGVKQYFYCIFFIFLLFAGIHKNKGILLIAIASVAFYIGSIFLVSVSGVWWPVPRAVYALGFAMGIALLLVYINTPQQLTKLFPAAAFIAASGFAFHSSAMLYDQIRLNRWDAWVASAVSQELAKFNVGPTTKVILVGASWGHPLGLRTSDGDLNTSALAVPWAANHLFMEVTGRRWEIESVRTSPECSNVKPWPNVGSIKQLNNGIYVCLGEQK